MRRAGRFHATRSNPESSGLSASLRHVSGWPVLSITASPQTMELQFVNRTPLPVATDATELQLLFRPGILSAIDQIALAPQSEADWVLSVGPSDSAGEIELLLVVVQAFRLAPGEARTVRIDGISAAEAGGSRATRVQFRYQGLWHDNGSEVAGSRLLHLPVLRRHEPIGPTATELRQASMAKAGPLVAGWLDGPDLLNDGRSENTLRLRIVNASNRPIPLADNADEATRLYLSYHTGIDAAQWGLLGSPADHLSLALPTQRNQDLQASWQIDNHTLRCITPTVWRSREWLDISLTIFTEALIGEAQLVLSFENLPGHDDGDLVLLAHPSPVAVHRLAGDATEDSAVQRFTVSTPMAVRGGLEVEGDLQLQSRLHLGAAALRTKPERFRLGGDAKQFYPVVFEDQAWSEGEFRLEVFRAHTHTDAQWHGSLMASLVCHSNNYGHGSGYWSLQIRQARGSQYFIGGFESNPHAPKHVFWLAGGTTYEWIANHLCAIVAPATLGEPAEFGLGTPGSKEYISYPPKSEADPVFRENFVSLSRTQIGASERDTGAVPSGAILMWSGAKDSVPLGWVLCDGNNGSPDLRGRFIVGSGSGSYSHGENFRFAYPSAESPQKPVDRQTGGRLEVKLTTHQTPPHAHTGKTNTDGDHYHHVPVHIDAGLLQSQPAVKKAYPPGNNYQFANVDEVHKKDTHMAPTTSRVPSSHHHVFSTDHEARDTKAHENLPPYYALCFIMKR